MAKKIYPSCNFREYSPSRNPYYEKLLHFSNSQSPLALINQNTENYRGRWRETFLLPPTSKLNFEIGSYNGETFLFLAKEKPTELFLGLEWKFKILYQAANKALAGNYKNLCFLRANAARLAMVVAPGEINRLQVLFPDPWPKEQQQKWRLLHPDYFRILAHLLGEGAELLIKTDDPAYADFIRESLKEVAAFDSFSQKETMEIWEGIPKTPFERIFLKQNLPIYTFTLFRNPKRVA